MNNQVLLNEVPDTENTGSYEKGIPVGWREGGGGKEILKNQKMVLDCDN
jgi:hypothetical protein